MNKLKASQTEYLQFIRQQFPVPNQFDAFRASPEYVAMLNALLSVVECEINGHIKFNQKKHDCMSPVREILAALGVV